MTGLEILLTGRGLVESPRWHEDKVYFSDWSAGEVISVGAAGESSVVAQVKSLPLCTAFLPDGRLLVVDSTQGRLSYVGTDGGLVPYAELGRPGWNDIVADGRGNVYVNRAGFDPMTSAEFRTGYVHLVTPDGQVSEVADDVAFPNGMAVTADNSTLIVADSYRRCLVAFDIGPDGTLDGRRVWADLGEGTPDGICVDAEGAVWYADVPHKQCVRVAEGGRVLRTVQADRGCFAAVLGGPDGTTLFVTAAEWQSMTGPELVAPGSGRLLCLEVEIPGAGWP